MKVEWDESKNKSNQKKHGVSFEEAATVFDYEESIVFDDPDHSIYEDRFLIIGFTSKLRICVVSWCERRGSVIRIISARTATRTEIAAYEEFAGR